MVDLIDRETAKRELLDKATIIQDRRFMKTDSAIAILDKLQAAAVRPVVFGKWITRKDCDSYVCSECGDEENAARNFCPCCGADMWGLQERTAANG